MELIPTTNNFIQSLIIFAWIIRKTSYLLSVTYVSISPTFSSYS